MIKNRSTIDLPKAKPNVDIQTKRIFNYTNYTKATPHKQCDGGFYKLKILQKKERVSYVKIVSFKTNS